MTARTAPLRRVTWRATAPYRPLMALMLVSSTASFAALGVLSLFARDELGASDTGVTVNFVVVALAGTAAMLVTGHFSDRRGVRRWAFARQEETFDLVRRRRPGRVS